MRLSLEVEVEKGGAGEGTLVNGAINTVTMEGGEDGEGNELGTKTFQEPLAVSGEPVKFGLQQFEFTPEDSEKEPRDAGRGRTPSTR